MRSINFFKNRQFCGQLKQNKVSGYAHQFLDYVCTEFKNWYSILQVKNPESTYSATDAYTAYPYLRFLFRLLWVKEWILDMCNSPKTEPVWLGARSHGITETPPWWRPRAAIAIVKIKRAVVKLIDLDETTKHTAIPHNEIPWRYFQDLFQDWQY